LTGIVRQKNIFQPCVFNFQGDRIKTSGK